MRLHFKLQYKAVAIKAVWHNNSHRGERNEIQRPELNFSLYGQLIYDKEGKTREWGKENLQ